MYPEKQEIVLFGIDENQLKPFVPEIKIRMNKGKAFNVKKVSSSKDVYDILQRIYGRNLIQENFIVLLFNRSNKLIGYYRHTLGTSYATIVDVPMVVGLATKAIAHGIIISHNHPSGNLTPSDADRQITTALNSALKLVSINLLDHLIYTDNGYYSFADEGILNGFYTAGSKQSINGDKLRKLKASDIPPLIKKFMPKFQQQVIIGSEEHFEIVERLEGEIKAIPKDTEVAYKLYETAKKKGKANQFDFYTVYAHFFHGASDWYVLSWDGEDTLFCYVILNADAQMSEMGYVSLSELHENLIELDFFWIVKPLSEALFEAYPGEFPKPDHKIKPKKVITSGTQEKIKHTEIKPEEKVNAPIPMEKKGLEVFFIKRYIGLHKKTKDKSQILSFLNSLQKAIVDKRIRKTSAFAAEIENIQTQLIKCYNQMGNTIEVSIDDKTLSTYSEIAQGENAMLSSAYIKQYISLHGRDDVKERAKALMKKIEKAIESQRITENNLHWNELSEIMSSLKSYINDKSQTLAIKETTLNGIMSWFAKRHQKKKIAKYLQKIYETERGLHGTEETADLNGTESPQVISSTQLPEMQFETMGLQGKYRELIGDPCLGFTAMVYGLPKSGKSTLCIDFAKYLAEHHGKVLYVAIEEKFGYTLKEKFERLNAIHPNLVIAEKLPDDLSSFQFVFIDSVSKAGLTADDLSRLHKDNPKIAFIFIFHTTKEGNFRGKQDFAHDVDVIIEVENGAAKANGRFGIGKEMRIFDHEFEQ